MANHRMIFRKELKLKTQLLLSMIVTFMLVLTISTYFIFSIVQSIIKSESEQTTLERLKQSEFNINTLISEIDKISRQLVISENLQALLEYNHSSDVQQVEVVNRIFKQFWQTIVTYNFIDSVYYFGEDGLIMGVTATRNDFVITPKEKNWFYKSETYNNVVKSGLKQVLAGGYNAEDFDVMGYNRRGSRSVDDTPYITSARGVQMNGMLTATLVINIDEAYFGSIYDRPNEATQNTFYIVDKSGQIISHRNSDRIGTTSKVWNQFGSYQSRSFVTEIDKDSVQVIYNAMVEPNWYIVDEIPMKIVIRDIVRLREILLVVFFVTLIASFVLATFWINKITKPLKELSSAMREMELGRLGHRLIEIRGNELGMLSRQFNIMSDSITQLIHENERTQERRRLAEIEALQAQINPHFLYNTLNTIKWMAVMIRAENIVDSITLLGNLLRPFFKTQSLLCTLSEELEYTVNYVKIMNYRFGEGIKIYFDVEECVRGYFTLRFILQPIIENCFVHSFRSQPEGMINVRILQIGSEIRIYIEDNGSGISVDLLDELKQELNSFDFEKTEKFGIGLINVNRRIKLHYGEQYGLYLSSTFGGGTIVELKIPVIHKS